jgi:hypothetical protein
MMINGQAEINHLFATNFSKESHIAYSVPFAIYVDMNKREFVKKRMKRKKDINESYVEHRASFKGDRVTFMAVFNICHLLVGYNNGTVELRSANKLKVRYKSEPSD